MQDVQSKDTGANQCRRLVQYSTCKAAYYRAAGNNSKLQLSLRKPELDRNSQDKHPYRTEVARISGIGHDTPSMVPGRGCIYTYEPQASAFLLNLRGREGVRDNTSTLSSCGISVALINANATCTPDKVDLLVISYADMMTYVRERVWV